MDEKIVLNLLKSKSPLSVALGLILILVGLSWAGLSMVGHVNDYTDKFETKEDHARDVDHKVEVFKKDVRVAILENNTVLLNQIDKRLRRERP